IVNPGAAIPRSEQRDVWRTTLAAREDATMATTDSGGPQGEGGTQRTRYDVSREDFVRAWESSRTLSEVSKRLGMPKAIVAARAAHSGRVGIPLRKRNQSLDEPNVTELNELIKRLRLKVNPRPATQKPVTDLTLAVIKRVVKEAVEESVKKAVKEAIEELVS